VLSGEATHTNFSLAISVEYENPTLRLGLEQSGPHHHLIEI
jgi:hypothetical protein